MKINGRQWPAMAANGRQGTSMVAPFSTKRVSIKSHLTQAVAPSSPNMSLWGLTADPLMPDFVPAIRVSYLKAAPWGHTLEPYL